MVLKTKQGHWIVSECWFSNKGRNQQQDSLHNKDCVQVQ